MTFEVAPGGAEDRAHHLRLFRPRVEPTTDAHVDEYQFPVYRGDDRYAISVPGDASMVEGEQTITLHLGSPSVLDGILEMKRYFDIQEEDGAFLLELAQGLVKVFVSRTDNGEALTYRVVVDAAVWRERGYHPSAEGLVASLPGEWILAEAHVPAHPSMGDGA